MEHHAAGDSGRRAAGRIFVHLVAPPAAPPGQLFGDAALRQIENIDQLLGYFQEVALWSPESQLAFVIDCGLSPQSADDCRRWCRDKKRVTFCTHKEVQEICKGVQDTVY